ncbi:hypothetical protein LINPERPRIM_LOCUS20317 [Linum perenne]
MKKYPTISENIGGLSIAQLDLLKSDNRNKVQKDNLSSCVVQNERLTEATPTACKSFCHSG